jgi:hypothetical protein
VECSGYSRELTSALWNFDLEKCREEGKKNIETSIPRISSDFLRVIWYLKKISRNSEKKSLIGFQTSVSKCLIKKRGPLIAKCLKILLCTYFCIDLMIFKLFLTLRYS